MKPQRTELRYVDVSSFADSIGKLADTKKNSVKLKYSKVDQTKNQAQLKRGKADAKTLALITEKIAEGQNNKILTVSAADNLKMISGIESLKTRITEKHPSSKVRNFISKILAKLGIKTTDPKVMERKLDELLVQLRKQIPVKDQLEVLQKELGEIKGKLEELLKDLGDSFAGNPAVKQLLQRRRTMNEQLPSLQQAVLKEEIVVLSNDRQFVEQGKKILTSSKMDSGKVYESEKVFDLLKSQSKKAKPTPEDLIPIGEALFLGLKQKSPETFQKYREILKNINTDDVDPAMRANLMVLQTAVEAAAVES